MAVNTRIGILPTIAPNTPTYYGDISIRNNTLVSTTFEEVNTMAEEFNSTATEVNTNATSASSSAASAATSASDSLNSALIAQSAANFKGIWASQGYTQGQSVQGSDGVFYICTVTHTTAQNPVSTTGYWVISVTPKVVGDLLNPLTNLNFSSAKAFQRDFHGELMFDRYSGAGYIDRYGKYIDAARYTGTATSGSVFNLVNTGEAWTAGALKDYIIKITTGTVIEYRWVIGNDDTSVSFAKPLSTPVTSSSTYILVKPRFDADGLICEGSITNLLLNDTINSNGLNCTYSASSTYVLGTTYVYKNFTSSVDSASEAYKDLRLVPPEELTDGKYYTTSVFINKNETTARYVWLIFAYGSNASAVFDFTTETFITFGTYAYGFKKYGDIYRIWVTAQYTYHASGLLSRIQFYGHNIGNVISFAFPQCEMGAFPTSYILATTAIKTRSEDKVSIKFAENSPSIKTGTPISIIAEARTYGASEAGQRLFDFGQGSDINGNCIVQIGGYYATTLSFYRSVAATLLDSSLPLINTRYAITVSSSNLVKTFKNGVLKTVATSIPFTEGSDATALWIGRVRTGGWPWQGRIKSIKIYQDELSTMACAMG